MMMGGMGGREFKMPKRAKEISVIEVKRLGEGVHAVGEVSRPMA
jgi:hypothetical protein